LSRMGVWGKVAVGGAVVGALYMYSKYSAALKKKEALAAAWRPVAPGDYVDLLPAESMPQFLMMPAPATLTFYKGSVAEAKAALKVQVTKLVEANPWLAGRQQKHGENKVKLWVPKVPSAADILGDGENDKVLPGDSWMDMNGPLNPLFSAKRGIECLNKNEPLFRVVVIKLTADPSVEQFAVMVSMSHLLGDGHTYYSLYGSLNTGTEPVVLNVNRQFGSDRKGVEAVGINKVRWMMGKPQFYGGLLNVIFRGIPTYSAYELNMNWVEEQKKAMKATASAGFVSSNDVLTSWFLQSGNYDAGTMVMNLRNRVEGLDDTHAGNYQILIHYWPEECSTASGVRKALLNPPHYKAGREDAPSTWNSLQGNWALVSSWVSFYKEVRLPGAEQVLHTPTAPPKLPVLCRECAFIFKPTPTTYAVCLTERGTKGRPDHPLLGKRIF